MGDSRKGFKSTGRPETCQSIAGTEITSATDSQIETRRPEKYQSIFSARIVCSKDSQVSGDNKHV